MDWATIAQLIIQVGMPATQAIISKWEAGTAPTSADFQSVLTMANKKASDEMAAQLAAAGIAQTDPNYQKFMALVS